jgi:hypothetical protein
MNCPKCKNPINDNATVCEWCGAHCASPAKTQQLKQKTNEPSDGTLGCLFLLLLLSVGLVITGIILFFNEEQEGAIISALVGALILIPLIRWFIKWMKK